MEIKNELVLYSYQKPHPLKPYWEATMNKLKSLEIPSLISDISEYLLLEAAMNINNFLDNGSSRAVYDIGHDLVLKVSVDEEGDAQNDVEYDFYYDTLNSKYLAKLYGMGTSVILMEKVEVMSYYEVYELLNAAQGWDADNYINEEYDENDKLIENPIPEIAYKIRETVDFLEDYLGSTSDNSQLGKSGDRIVAFDYGFVPQNEGNVSNNLSRMFDYFDDTVVLEVAQLRQKGYYLDEALEELGLEGIEDDDDNYNDYGRTYSEDEEDDEDYDYDNDDGDKNWHPKNGYNDKDKDEDSGVRWRPNNDTQPECWITARDGKWNGKQKKDKSNNSLSLFINRSEYDEPKYRNMVMSTNDLPLGMREDRII